jgi:hypothetical protein
MGDIMAQSASGNSSYNGLSGHTKSVSPDKKAIKSISN